MNASTIYEAECITRSIARWGSAVAILIFGVAFLTDRALSWHIVSHQLIQIGLISTIFIGYVVAVVKRYELMGSVVSILSVLTAYFAYLLVDPPITLNLIFLVVAVPALFHIAAIVLHRYLLTRK